MINKFYLHDEEETLALGNQFAQTVLAMNAGLTVFLEGTLGAGKTTFCRGVLRGLGHSAAVKSPTYTLVEPYSFSGLKAYHFDLYRLGSAEELEYMGVRDYFSESALCLIEWPSRGRGVLPAPDVKITLTPDHSGRVVALEGVSELGQKSIAAIGLKR